MSPTEKMQQVNEQNGTKLDRLIAEAIALAESDIFVNSAAERMMDIADELAVPIADIAVCKRGCSHCCKQAVLITEWEAAQIAQATKRKVARAPEHPLTRLRSDVETMRAQYAGVDCSFLSAAGECTVYEARPYVCRSHFSLEDSPDPCDIINRPKGIVASYNNRAMDFAYSMLFASAGARFADIREFFPKEQT